MINIIYLIIILLSSFCGIMYITYLRYKKRFEYDKIENANKENNDVII